MKISYSVAIRTLGKSGWMYQTLIESLKKQTVPAEAIFVYIAEGYLPPDRVADEIFIVCKKGMVAQRALNFDEIHSEYILFCDDDLQLEENAVENFLNALQKYQADGISANMYPNHLWSKKEKFAHALLYGELPSFQKKYAFSVRRSGYYSYATSPVDVMQTQSFAGGCYMVRKDAVSSIHFKDEEWLDSFRYALGDDQLFSYKLYCHGFKILVHYNPGITHLDAQTGHTRDMIQADKDSRIIHYIIWHRTIYSPAGKMGKIQAVLAYYTNWILLFLVSLISCILGKSTFRPRNSIAALREGRQWIKREEYTKIPQW